MKRKMFVILLVLASVLLTASTAAPIAPVERLSGTLLWTRSSTCMLQDYVPLPVMENVYLTGYRFPSRGEYHGCHIDAAGRYLTIGTCKVFQVSSASISCSLVSGATGTR